METLGSKLSYEDKEAIHDGLAETTVKHLQAKGSVFGKLSFDPLTHSSQDLGTLQLSAIPTTPEKAEELITLASPRLYPFLVSRLKTQEHYTRTLSKKRSSYTAQGNVVHLNTHQSIEDIVALMAARSVAENFLIDMPWHEIVTSNFTIISRGVATLEAFGYAAPEAVRQGGNVFLSFPRSDTITRVAKSITLPDEVTMDEIIDENNALMREAVADFMPGITDIEVDLFPYPTKKRVGYIATSGSTDQVEGDVFEPERISLQEASPALVKMLKGASIAPTVTWDRGDTKEPIFVTGELTTIKKTKDLQRIQEWHRKTLATHLDLADDRVTIRPLS